MSVALFALATLAPAVLVALGAVVGGIAAWLPLLAMAGLVPILDRALAGAAPDPPEGAEFPGSDALLATLALFHLAALPLVVHGVAAPGPWPSRAALGLGAALWFGQVVNPAAHELIHRADRGLRRLGVVAYASLLFGHHASAHRLVHHLHAASAGDPNTARAGEGFYRFAVRAWAGSFVAGWRAEAARGGLLRNPYLAYGAISGASLGVGYLVAGWRGMLAWTLLAGLAQSQLLLADYVQHYGLIRARRADGRLEPMADGHSWNAPHRASGRLMLNAPRHSDHHSHPARPYPALRLPSGPASPRLPWALPVCCTVALVPPLWRRAIHPRLADWRRARQSVTGQARPSAPSCDPETRPELHPCAASP